jgi:hypothetical protein
LSILILLLFVPSSVSQAAMAPLAAGGLGAGRASALTSPAGSVADQASRQLLDAIMEKSRSIVENLRGLRDDELRQPSELPEWSRLTIACHLRFGAGTLLSDDGFCSAW